MDRRDRDYARDMRRRDREMRREDMRRRRNSRGQYMSDRNMGDGRNPYGSRGGYVTSDRGMDYGRDYNDMRGRDGREYGRGNDYGSHEQYDYARNDRGYERNREYRGTFGNTPFNMTETQRYEHDMRRGDYGDMRGRDYADYGDYGRGRDYNYDMRSDYGEVERLSKEDLEDWCEDLMKELDQDEKEMFKMDRVLKRAEDMGIKFEKDKFTENEFYIETLASYTDFKELLGKGNVDGSILHAKLFLCDKDAGNRYWKKLSNYHDYIAYPM